MDKIPNALNSKLPKDISIIDCIEVDGEFHSRYNAKGKTYRYLIYITVCIEVLYIKIYLTMLSMILTFDKMVKESKYLIGTHDFKGFMSSGSSVKDTVREIYGIRLTKQESLVY